VHVCVDDATRLAYAEVLCDEKATTAIAFLRRALAFYAAHGITVQRVMTDNGAAYRSTAHALACRVLGVVTCAPDPDGHAPTARIERFIKTMIAGWNDGAIYGSSRERAGALTAGCGPTDESQVGWTLVFLGARLGFGRG
jgi:Integrase core domain